MTLDEAIGHSREVAAECGPCADDHRVLASFLVELKERRAGISWSACDGCSIGCRTEETSALRWRSQTSYDGDHVMLCPECQGDGTGREVGP